MTLDDFTQIIAEVQSLQSELDDVEVKSAKQGTPQRLFEALLAFSNRTGGGVLLWTLMKVNALNVNAPRSGLGNWDYKKKIEKYR